MIWLKNLVLIIMVLFDGNNYCSFVGEMKKYCGKKLRIDTIKNLGNTYYYTMIAIPWTFTSEMFEKGDLSMLITRRQECIK